jgi:hydrogenase expression/formation protein HypE
LHGLQRGDLLRLVPVCGGPVKGDRILLAHGSGGRLSQELIEELFLPAFSNPALSRMDDSAVLELAPRDASGGPGYRLAVTTDAHVVKPLFFQGGDIGRLAVCGTINDLAMVGAQPLCLTAAFVLEEGLPVAVLRQVVASMRSAAEEAGVGIVAGDTKVVERGGADGLFVTTTGLGLVPDGIDISSGNAKPGDVVLLSGSVGDHGIAVLSRREGLEFAAPVASDTAPLNHLVAAMLEAGPRIRCMRDPTRGGLATALKELAARSAVAIEVEEARIPVDPAVQAACEMLGYDPLYIANEGKLVAIAHGEDGEQLLRAMRRTRYGEHACVIGRVLPGPVGKVLMRTGIGGTRILHTLSGELLPRIC